MPTHFFSPCAAFAARRRQTRRSRNRLGPRPHRLRALPILIAIFLVLAATDASRLIARPDLGLAPGARYNAASFLNEAATEVTRLEAVATAFLAPGGAVEAARLKERLALTSDRLHALTAEPVQALIGPVPHLLDVQQRIDPLLHTVPTAGAMAELPGALYALNQELTRLATLTYAEARTAAANSVRRLEQDHWTLAGILMALIACSFALNFLLNRHNQMLVEARDEVEALVKDLRITSAQLARANQVAQDAMAEVRQRNETLQARDSALSVQNARFDAALNNMSQALCMVDGTQRLIVSNVRFPSLLGLPVDAVQPGLPVSEVFNAARDAGRLDPRLIAAIETAQSTMISDRTAGSFTRETDGGQAVAVSHRPMADGGWVATYEDITLLRQAEAQLHFLAQHDALTGLPNRAMLVERLETLLRDADRIEGRLAVLMLDLDSFQAVNDALGHQAGDAILSGVSDRLRDLTPRGGIVGRIGSDEFAILHTAGNQPHDAEALARNVRDALAEPYDIDGRTAVVTASIGVAMAPGTDIDAGRLMQRAGIALARARADGGGTYHFFDPDMDARTRVRRAMELDLRQALPNNELRLLYQPIVSVRSGQLVGFEALLRWQRPGYGAVSPEEFIPMAEELGLIVPIGEWALRQACRDAVTWPAHLRVAVNLSAVQVRGATLVRTVEDALAESGLRPQNLELEITETALLTGEAAVSDTLQRLRALGLHIALDDFGTGYSSLSYLLRFPFDKLKIDQSFVREMATRTDCRAIVHSIADLAEQLSITTTAEGVESEAQLALVREAGCAEVQGYHFDKPRSAKAIRRWFDDGEGTEA